MNRNRTLCWTAAAAVAALALAGWHGAAVAQNRSTPARETPRFAVDPSWPKIPNGWVLGQVSSAATDERDHVWVLHRPRVVRPGLKTGPPVMEFDAAGNYIQGWGGAAQGYDWPATEHGIYVDYKGYVWICGSGDDDQVLKFTKAGKFVMQIGRKGRKKTNRDTESFWKPTEMAVYPKTNEVFVADGYGNKRIIVFDADTGAYKRMWGAFGNVPQDGPASGEASGGPAQPESTRIPAKEIDPKDPGPSQFDTVHDVKVSNDGFVYVSDRGGKRVQVFTIDGKFVAQTFIDRWCEAPHCGNGQTAASAALFSADPAQRFLYVASRSPERIWVLDRKTLQPVDSFGRPGVAPGEFYVLHHLVADSKGNLYASEVEDGRRIQKFVLQGTSPAPAR
jgi:NHL repeat